MNFQKNSAVINLVEKGFAVRGHGEATIVCDEFGQPVYLAPKLFPNGALGGSVSLVKRDAFDTTKARAHVMSEDLFSVAVVIHGQVVSIEVRAYDAVTLDMRLYEARGELTSEGTLQLMDVPCLTNQEGCWDLVTGSFNGALDAAILRAQDKMPSHIYWGKLSPDAREVRKLERQHAAA